MGGVLGTYDGPGVRHLLEEAGVLDILARKGFTSCAVEVETAGRALPHALLYGCKGGVRYLLLDACVGEAVVRPEFFAARGYALERALDFAVVHWVREQDPTARFSAARPPLPLQRHPGLGVLRHAFRVVVRMAGELQMDGVANVPKFFHDAVIFFRSRLFLFLDGKEQGRFEALLRDLAALPLGDASLALVGGGVRDAHGAVAQWEPGYLVFPIAPEIVAYFHSTSYADQVAASYAAHRFTWDPDALAATRASIATPA